MYHTPKIKSWIKKASKNILMYDKEEQLISDNHIIIRVLPDMHPAIVEAFGHLNGGCIKDGKYLESTYNMAKYLEVVSNFEDTLTDSGLRYSEPNAKGEYRILYFPNTGKKIILDQKYAELFKNFVGCTLVTAGGKKAPVVVRKDGIVIGAILPINLLAGRHLVLETFDFKTGDR